MSQSNKLKLDKNNSFSEEELSIDDDYQQFIKKVDLNLSNLSNFSKKNNTGKVCIEPVKQCISDEDGEDICNTIWVEKECSYETLSDCDECSTVAPSCSTCSYDLDDDDEEDYEEDRPYIYEEMKTVKGSFASSSSPSSQTLSKLPTLVDIKDMKKVKDDALFSSNLSLKSNSLPPLHDIIRSNIKSDSSNSFKLKGLPDLHDMSSLGNALSEVTKIKQTKSKILPEIYDTKIIKSKYGLSSEHMDTPMINTNVLPKLHDYGDENDDHFNGITLSEQKLSSFSDNDISLNCGMIDPMKCKRLGYVKTNYKYFYDLIMPSLSNDIKKLNGKYLVVIPSSRGLSKLGDGSNFKKIASYHIIPVTQELDMVLSEGGDIMTGTLSKYPINVSVNGRSVMFNGVVALRDTTYSNIFTIDTVLMPNKMMKKNKKDKKDKKNKKDKKKLGFQDHDYKIDMKSDSISNRIGSMVFQNNNSLHYNNALNAMNEGVEESLSFDDDELSSYEREYELDTRIMMGIQNDNQFNNKTTNKIVEYMSMSNYNGSDHLTHYIRETKKINKETPEMNIKIYDMENIFNHFKDGKLTNKTSITDENILMDIDIGFDETDISNYSFDNKNNLSEYIIPQEVEIFKDDMLNHLTEFTFNHPHEEDTYSSVLLSLDNSNMIDSDLYTLTNSADDSTILFRFKDDKLKYITINYDTIHNNDNYLSKFNDPTFDINNIKTTMHLDNDFLSEMSILKDKLDFSNFSNYLLGAQVLKKKAKKTNDGDDDSNTTTTTTTKKKGRVARFVRSAKKKLKTAGRKIKKTGRYVNKKVIKPTKRTIKNKVIAKTKQSVYSKLQSTAITLRYKNNFDPEAYIKNYEEDSTQKKLFMRVEVMNDKNEILKTKEEAMTNSLFFNNTITKDEHIVTYDIAKGIRFNDIPMKFLRLRAFNPIASVPVIENFELVLSPLDVKSLTGKDIEVIQSEKIKSGKLQFTILFKDGDLTEINVWFKKEKIPTTYKSDTISSVAVVNTNISKLNDKELLFCKLVNQETKTAMILYPQKLNYLLEDRLDKFTSNFEQLHVSNKEKAYSNISNTINFLVEFNKNIKSFANKNNIMIDLKKNVKTSQSDLSTEQKKSQNNANYIIYANPKITTKNTFNNICLSICTMEDNNNTLDQRAKLTFDTLISEKNLNLNDDKYKSELLTSLNFISNSILQSMLTINIQNQEKDLKTSKTLDQYRQESYKELSKYWANM